MTDSAPTNLHVEPGAGRSALIGGMFGVIAKISADLTRSRVAIVEHTLAPKQLGAPPHKHSREDEFSFVLEGQLTVEQLGKTVTVGPGGYVAKPRDIMHAFWNAGAEPVRFVEIIAPGDFATYFYELDELFKSGQVSPDNPGAILALAARYGMEMDFGRIPELVQKHDLQIGTS
ncbi:MAG: cupin domain-containing protein [Candidatus Promineifilaceae bacterium]|nr:cupin domain-containing protein [Candidatus Promineifilaceae bacterium]